MSRSHRKNRKESNLGINSKETTHEFVDNSSKNDCIFSKRIKETKKRDFISRVYRDTGFICEA